ncbi:MAG: hypothetical protein ACRDGV_10775 [Candidatus Limnocylindria bacterium]
MTDSVSPPPAVGAIYDIGYRRYDGPRRGRSGAVRAIFGAGLRAAFGLGRPFRSKLWPFGAVVLALIPALIAVAIPALLNQAAGPGASDFLQLFSYDNYLWNVGGILPIFLASQAPELVVSDRRYQVLPLYFSRPIQHGDYLWSRLASLVVALLALTLLPLLVFWLGTVLLDADILAALGDEAGALPGIVGSGLMFAVVLAAIGLAVSSYAARRAYAAGAVIAVFLVGGATGGILGAQGGAAAWAILLDPLAVLDGARDWLFGEPISESPASASPLPLPVFGAAAAGYLVLSLAALAWRYRRSAS